MSPANEDSEREGHPAFLQIAPSNENVQINLDAASVPSNRAPPAPPPLMSSPPDTSMPPVTTAIMSDTNWTHPSSYEAPAFNPVSAAASQPSSAEHTSSATTRSHEKLAAHRRQPQADPESHQPDEGRPVNPYDNDARRRRNDDRRRRRRERAVERAAAEQVRELEEEARRLFIGGFFALPLLWLISLIYFHKEHADENASQIIKKYYTWTLRMFIVYTIVFVAWFIVFQLNSGALSAINILEFEGRGPSGI